MPKTRSTKPNSKPDHGDTKNHVQASLRKRDDKVSMPVSPDLVKRNTSHKKKVTPVEVKHEAEAHITTHEGGSLTVDKINKMFKDRGVLMPDWLINDLTQFSSRTVSEESTINYSKKKVIELKEELEQRGIAFRKCAKKAELIRLLENPNGIFTDSGNKENIPPKIDKASKQDVDSGKYPSGGIKRLEKTTKKPSMRTTSSSSNLNAQPALVQPENQYDCAKCGHLFASEELHKEPTSGDAYYAYLRYKDHTSNKTYRLQVSKTIFLCLHFDVVPRVLSPSSNELSRMGTNIIATLHTGSHMCIPPMKI